MNNCWIKTLTHAGFAPLAVLVFAFSASAQSYYEIVNLGALPGQADSFANHINSSGTVVGSSGSRAFVSQNCTMKDLGTLGGSQASAQSISKQGAIVGWSLNAAGRKRAFGYGGVFGGAMTKRG